MNNKYFLTLDIDNLAYLSKLLVSRQEGTKMDIPFPEEMSNISYILEEMVRSLCHRNYGEYSVIKWHNVSELPSMGEEILIKYSDGKVFADTVTVGSSTTFGWDIVGHDIDRVVAWSRISDIQ